MIGTLDPFSQKRLGDVAERWLTLDRQLRQACADLRTGAIMRRFSQDELDLLTRAGYLSLADSRAIRESRQ